MATELDSMITEQNAVIRLARGSLKLIDEYGATIAAGAILTFPTDPIDVTNHKRIVGRLSHSATMTAGKLAIEFSDTEAFTNITFHDMIDLNITTNPIHEKMGATIAADEDVYCADFDTERMDNYFRCRVRNDVLGAECTFNLNANAKVM